LNIFNVVNDWFFNFNQFGLSNNFIVPSFNFNNSWNFNSFNDDLVDYSWNFNNPFLDNWNFNSSVNNFFNFFN
jgi:hypothetical protein